MASVSLFDEDVMITQVCIDNFKTHSQKIMPIIQSAMDSIDWSMKDIDLIGVGVGPGSFTGIRIAMSVAKALSQPFDIPIVPVSSLKAMCYEYEYFEGVICPMFDARRTQVYTGVYANVDNLRNWTDKSDAGTHFLEDSFSQNQFIELLDERCILIDDLLKIFCDDDGELGYVEPDDVVKKLTITNSKILFMGDGARNFKDQIIDRLGDRAVFAPISMMMPRASAVGIYAIKTSKEGYKSYNDIDANYLRRSEAEVNWEKHNGKS